MSEFKQIELRLIKIFNILLMAGSYIFIWFLVYSEEVRAEVSIPMQLLLLLTCMGIYISLGRIYEAFLLGLERIRDMVYSQMLTACISDFFAFFVLLIAIGSIPAFPAFLLILPTQLVISVCWSACANSWYFKHFPPKRTLIVARDIETAERILQIKDFSKMFHVINILTTDQLLQTLDTALENIEVVVLLDTQNAWSVMQLCAFKSVTIYRVPLVSEIIASRATSVTLFHTPMLRMAGYRPDMSYVAVKRCMDILFSGVTLLLLLPIMAVIAIAIRLEDKGPVFYRQERLTQKGRHFYILKFRSMRVNAESDGVARLSTGAKDDRVTKVGRILRKLRLDEVPQLINILKGDMSIVGPRPERPEIAQEYAKVFPEFNLRLLSKAGLTGYAQVYGKYNTTPEDKLRMDLMYILRPSILEDIRIILATVKILFVPESTEGVEEGKTTAIK